MQGELWEWVPVFSLLEPVSIMSPETASAEESLARNFEALSVSKRLVRSLSQKLRKKSHRGEVEEEDNARGVSLKCLTLYGRGGGCKVSADTSEEFGDPGSRRRSSASDEGKVYKTICSTEESGVDCFSYGVKEKLWKKNNRKDAELDSVQNSRMHIFLPDDILEMCLVRLPLISLMNARLVCKKWRYLTSTPRFFKMRLEGSHQKPWLFLFGAVKDSYCSGEIYALDVSEAQWHTINADFLKGRFMFSVASAQDNVVIVGGRSSLSNFGRVDRSSYKTHKDVLVFSPLTKSWHEVASMKYARSMPILGIAEVSADFFVVQRHQIRPDRRFTRTRGGATDVYADPHRLSLRRHYRNSFDENEPTLLPSRKSYKFTKQRSELSNTRSGSRKFVLIAVGGLGSWDEPLDSGEIYDSVSNKWTEIQRLPPDFGVVCSGVVCNGVFYVYSEADKLSGYDVERGFWFGIQTSPFPPHVHEYHPKLVSCNGRLFMLSVSWCEGDGQIGQRNKAVRKLWELDLMYLSWIEVSVHPDAPMDWNAVFVADRNKIFGLEMFKIFGQVLDFFTVCNISDMPANWTHISRNHLSHEFDASSCMIKTLAIMHL